MLTFDYEIRTRTPFWRVETSPKSCAIAFEGAEGGITLTMNREALRRLLQVANAAMAGAPGVVFITEGAEGGELLRCVEGKDPVRLSV